MTTTTPESRARIAYTAYGRKVHFKAVNGEIMPMFGALPDERKEAWIAAANAVWDLATTGRADI